MTAVLLALASAVLFGATTTAMRVSATMIRRKVRFPNPWPSGTLMAR